MITEDLQMPQATDIEEMVLGQLMYDREACDNAMPILNVDMFYAQKHKRIFTAISHLYTNSKPIDVSNVFDILKSKNEHIEITAYYLSGLNNRIGTAQNLEVHTAILQEKYFAREIIDSSRCSIRDAFNPSEDIFETLESHTARIEKVYDSIEGRRKPDTIEKLSEKSFQDYFARKNAIRENKTTGIPTGLTDLNKATGGWQNGNLIIIAARPAMGKTALACNFSISGEKSGAIVFFSLEMTAREVADRLLMFISGLDALKFKDGYLSQQDEESLLNAKETLSKMKLSVIDKSAISINYMRSCCRRIKKESGLSMIIVDYLQLMSAVGLNRNSNREQEINSISRGLKAIAKEFDVPVIALSQLSRAVEQRGGDKKPQLSDLRESGAIEQDADIVIFVYRPAYYEFEQDAEGNSTEGIGQLIIAKNRNGKTTTVKFKHNESLTQIYDEYPAQSALQPNTNFYESERTSTIIS